MPCNLGYKSIAKAVIADPQPQTFKEKISGTKIDSDLLKKLGNEDPEFLEWATNLDSEPLLQAALKRALSKVNAGGVRFSLNSEGMLEAKGEYLTASERKKLSDITSQVSDRWQFEMIGIVAELMNYEVRITENGKTLTLEAEEEGKSHPCDYIKVAKDGDNATLTLEHFKSREALELETTKLLVLAAKLGVKIKLSGVKIAEGDPMPGAGHHSHSHGTGHRHNHEG